MVMLDTPEQALKKCIDFADREGREADALRRHAANRALRPEQRAALLANANIYERSANAWLDEADKIRMEMKLCEPSLS